MTSTSRQYGGGVGEHVVWPPTWRCRRSHAAGAQDDPRRQAWGRSGRSGRSGSDSPEGLWTALVGPKVEARSDSLDGGRFEAAHASSPSRTAAPARGRRLSRVRGRARTRSTPGPATGPWTCASTARSSGAACVPVCRTRKSEAGGQEDVVHPIERTAGSPSPPVALVESAQRGDPRRGRGRPGRSRCGFRRPPRRPSKRKRVQDFGVLAARNELPQQPQAAFLTGHLDAHETGVSSDSRPCAETPVSTRTRSRADHNA